MPGPRLRRPFLEHRAWHCGAKRARAFFAANKLADASHKLGRA
jgi:hypothetical protein